MKKLTPYLLIAYFVLQLAVPAYFVFRHYNTLHTGESYKFEVAPYDPYDPFRGRYIALRPTLSLQSSGDEYILLEHDSNGFAVISGRQPQKPTSGQYVKNLQLNRYYMNEIMAPEAERIQRSLTDTDSIYLLVKVKNGDYVIEGLYLNDIPIEQYITNT